MDVSWDSITYHLPFAALRTGIITQRQYHLSTWFAGLYAGMPVLPDYLQGMIWRLTSRPQGANFLGLIALLIATCFFWLRHKIPFGLLLAALLGVPAILLQSTSALVDLFTNSFATITIFSIFIAWIDPETFSIRDVIIALICLAVAVNTKTQFVLVGSAALLGMAVVAYFNRHRLLVFRQHASMPRWKRALFITFVACTICLNYGWEIRNTIKLHNPVYPVAVTIGHTQLRGMFPAGGLGRAEPRYLANAPGWERWILSVVEFNAFDGRNPLWTNAQGDLPPDSHAVRMGGTFGALALFNGFLFLALQKALRSRYGLKPFWFMTVVTVMTAFMPASQEIRYYLYWIMCLIIMNLYLILNGLSEPERSIYKLLTSCVIASFLLFVLCATDFQYVRAHGYSPEFLAKGAHVEEQLNAMHVQKGEAICVENKQPATFLYSPNFNPNLASRLDYHIYQGWNASDEAVDCAGHRVLH